MRKRLLVGALALVWAGACAGRRAPRVPETPPPHVDEGLASWYGLEEAGRTTASGEVMAPERLTAAHRTLPFGTLVRVTAIDTGNQVEVIINDRGPFKRGRIIDLSFAAARDLGIVEKGVAPVRIEVIGLEGPLAERRWRVQLGSFEDESRALELVNQVRAQGYSPVVISRFVEGGTLFHRVWVGEFRERDGAERLARELERAGHPGFALLAAAPST